VRRSMMAMMSDYACRSRLNSVVLAHNPEGAGSCPRYQCHCYQVVAVQRPDRQKALRPFLIFMTAWWQQDRAAPAGCHRRDWQEMTSQTAWEARRTRL
jgi:hypothetical protein